MGTTGIGFHKYKLPELSPKEFVVLKLAASGDTNEEIAIKLGLKVGTAKTHMSHIFVKLEARNRAHAVARAYSLDILDEEATKL